MKFGLRYGNTGRYVDPVKAVELAQAGEEAGFESLWTVEHTVLPGGYESAYPYSDDGKIAGGNNEIPLPDPIVWMAYVAAATSRICLMALRRAFAHWSLPSRCSGAFSGDAPV